MADLTPLDEKLGEVLGLAQAAQDATQEGQRDGRRRGLQGRSGGHAHGRRQYERRTDALVDNLEGRKTAIRELARETKAEAVEMMKTYLGDETEALDGFEFLSMAEAGELAHWEIVQKIAHTAGERRVAELADWAVPVQRAHIETVREASLALAAEEAKEMASASA